MPAATVAALLPTDSFNVVTLAATFVLIALGLHLTFGLLNIVNLVHGEFLLVGAYTTFQIQESTGSVVLGMLIAPLVAGILGVLIERGLLRFLYERPLDSLLATFGLAVIIRQLIQLRYSANPRTVEDPIGGSFEVTGFNIPWWRSVVVTTTIVLVIVLIGVLGRTGFGLRARATIRNPDLAEIMGVNTGMIRAALFGIGSAIAGAAGALLAPLNTVNPQFGTRFLVNSFLVVIVGGQGSLRGLIAAGVLLGGSLAILQFQISTVFAQIYILVIAIVGVRLRPIVVAHFGR